MHSPQINQSVRGWVYGKQRKVPIRAVYPKRNVIDMSGWSWARAVRNVEATTHELKYIDAQLAKVEPEHKAFIREIAEAVVEKIHRQTNEAKDKEKRKAKVRKPKK